MPRSAEGLARDLAAAIPGDDHDGKVCVFCAHSIAFEDAGGGWQPDLDPEMHEDDCPWRTARVWALAHSE